MYTLRFITIGYKLLDFIDILRISELKWTGMGQFNSDDHYIYYCRQESLRRNGVAIMVNKRVQNAVLGYDLKNDRMVSVRFQGKSFNITVIQVYAPTSNAEEAEVEWFYEDLQDILGISELKWTGMGKFNSDDHYVYYCGQESLRRNGVAFMVYKRDQNSILGCNLKMTKWSLFVSKANHSMSQQSKSMP